MFITPKPRQWTPFLFVCFWFFPVSIYFSIFWKCTLVLIRKVTPLYHQVWASWCSSRPFNLSQIPDCSYCPRRDPMWAKNKVGRCEMRPFVIMKPIQGQAELMMEKHQVQMTLFKPLTRVAQNAEIFLDFSGIANASPLLLSQFGLGFCHLQQNITTIS